MSLILNKLDEKIIYIFSLLKINVFFTKIKILLKFPQLIKKFNKKINSNFPNLHKLFIDLLNVFYQNKDFILLQIRLYLYITIILYIFVFFSLSFILALQFKSLIFFGEILFWLFKKWIWPIRKFINWTKYIYNKIKFVLMIIYNFIKHIVINFLNKIKSSGSGKNESLMKKFDDDDNDNEINFNDFGKSPQSGRSSGLSSTEWELNCMKNKTEKINNLYNFTSKWKLASQLTSTNLDLDLDKDSLKTFTQIYNDFQEKKDIINNKNWCPNNFEKEDWNSFIEKKQFKK
jgi:hypothetical protein